LCVIASALLFQFEKIKRTFQVNIPGRDYVKIFSCGVYGGVAEKLADGIKVVALV
jgi:hypothetical protein